MVCVRNFIVDIYFILLLVLKNTVNCIDLGSPSTSSCKFISASKNIRCMSNQSIKKISCSLCRFCVKMLPFLFVW